ncbi:hypothetical protein [Enterococcus faecalis]|uniref:hypothetical protein n=1 Tax=Enterococcus faecalis TaxID=1351 RepID=UPI0021C7D356|nr:hypothetical protein [Enterococcus faecalis]MCU2201938.1 hypothetical protein [Enterococcus faecalis]
MSENLKTIKELADELGISKKYLQNKISYEKKKQKLSIGNWKKISGKNTIVLSQKEQALIKSWLDEADSLGDKQEDKADSLGNKQEDKEKTYLKERIFVLEKFLDKEQTSNSELKKIIQQTQNLLDQQQRLALQDKKLLEEYKAENDNLKALKMPSQETEFKHLDNQYKDEVNALKEKLENLQEQIKDQKRIEEQEKPRKWWGLWRK